MGIKRENYGQPSMTQRTRTVIPEYEVDCVHRPLDWDGFQVETQADIGKPDRPQAHSNIERLGGPEGNWSRLDVFFKIVNQQAKFFTVDQTTGKKAYLVPINDPARGPYVRTSADATAGNNLLSLRGCR